VIATKAAMGAAEPEEIDEPCLDLADMWLVVPRPRFAVGGPDWPVTKQTVN
jgi:hypothetical protein